MDFLAIAQLAVGAAWDDLDAQSRGAAVHAAKVRWLEEELDGDDAAPSAESYPQWLAAQPADLQDEILGRRADAFRAGLLKVDRYADPTTTLSLDQLATRRPEAYSRTTPRKDRP